MLRHSINCTLIFAFLIAAPIVFAQTPADPQIEKAVATLRNIHPDKFTDEQLSAKAKEIDESWKLLISKGASAAARLKQEIEKVDAGKENDDFFKLNASVVLWNIGKANEADYIAKVWTSTPIERQYTYVFLTAFEAAQTQDPRVLPMLRAILRDDKGAIYISAHAMNVAWPLSQEFVWGAYGPQALPVLAEILETSKNDIELRSAMVLLARNQYLPSLPKIRQLASSANLDVRRQAIQSLGIFGHPTDYDRLVAGLASTETKELFSHAFALYEFEDERAVSHLIPVLNKGDDQLKVEVSLALLHLLTPESLAAVKKFVAAATNAEVKEFLQRSITLREDKLPKDYATRPRAEQAKLMAGVRNDKLIVRRNDQPFTNRQMLDALKVWTEKGRIYDSGIDWVGEQRMIAAAAPENIDAIVGAKAAFYRRLSDECLYEVRDLDTVIKYAGRSRYRTGIGVTERAELRPSP